MYSEPLVHALSPCEGPVESDFNLIQNPLGVLCKDVIKWEMNELFFYTIFKKILYSNPLFSRNSQSLINRLADLQAGRLGLISSMEYRNFCFNFDFSFTFPKLP